MKAAIFALLLASLIFSQCIVITDDFKYGSDNEVNKWIIIRANNDLSSEVVWTGQYVLLTAIEYGRAGALYLKLNLTRYYKWQVDFIYFIGNSTDSYPADGLALNFYREPLVLPQRVALKSSL